MEHLKINGGEQYLGFARNVGRNMRNLGLAYMSKVLDVGDTKIRIRIDPKNTYISIESIADPLYQFVTTGLSVKEEDPDPDILAATRGHVVGVEYDDKTKKLKGKALGSTLEQDTVDPPRWKYNRRPAALGRYLPYQLLQMELLPLAIFYPDVKTSKIVQTVWTSAIEIGDADSLGWSPSLSRADFQTKDRGYDAAVMVYTRPGRPGGGNGFAPDADWYRKAAITRVKSEEWGDRTYCLMTSVDSVLHVFRTTEVDNSLNDDSVYASQSIKTNIPESSVVRADIPIPAYARQRDTMSARSFGVGKPLARVDYTPPLTCKRWEFNSTGTRMASVLISDTLWPINGEARDEPIYTGLQVGGVETSFGMHEVEIVITVTGEEDNAFTVALNVINEVAPEAGRCIIGVGYYWGDIPDLHNPTSIDKDTLLCIEMDVYQKPETGTFPIEPTFIEEMSITSVKEFNSGRVIKSFVSSHIGAPLGLRGGPKEKSLMKLDWDEYAQDLGSALMGAIRAFGFNGNEVPAAQLRLSIQEKLVTLHAGVDAMLDAPTFKSTPAAQSQYEHLVQKCCDDAIGLVKASGYSDLKGYRKSMATVNLQRSDHLYASVATLKLRCAFLAYDLRVLGFAIQRSYFHDDEDDASSRQDRVTVHMRNEVKHRTEALGGVFAVAESLYDGMTAPPGDFVRIDPGLMQNPKKSLRATRAAFMRGLQPVSEKALRPEVWTDFNVDYSIGQTIYRYSARELMSCGAWDIFCIHPHGHWSLKTSPLIYYPTASKYVMPGVHKAEVIVPENDPDPADFVQHEIDIVSVVVQDEGMPKEVMSTHLELFNEAYHRTPALTPADFRHSYGLSIFRSGGGFDIKTVTTDTVGVPPVRLNATYAAYRYSPHPDPERRRTRVIVSQPLTYLDARVVSLMGFSQFDANTDNASIGIGVGSFNQFLPTGRGSCMFTRRKEISA